MHPEDIARFKVGTSYPMQNNIPLVLLVRPVNDVILPIYSNVALAQIQISKSNLFFPGEGQTLAMNKGDMLHQRSELNLLNFTYPAQGRLIDQQCENIDVFIAMYGLS